MNESNLEVYIWDTKEQQALSKPYGFFVFPDNFLDIYKQKRRLTIDSLEQGLEDKKLSKFAPIYDNEQLANMQEFLTEGTIMTLNRYIEENNSIWKNEKIAEHFFRLLKKADLRKLRETYDRNFRNVSKQDLQAESKALLSQTLMLYVGTKDRGYLQALSTALKLNDALISDIDNLNLLEKKILLSSLEREEKELANLEERITTMSPPDIAPQKPYARDHPTTIEDLGMLLQQGSRSKAYLQSLIKAGLFPNFVLLLKDPNTSERLDSLPEKRQTLLFDSSVSEEESIKKAGISYEIIQAASCNEPQVVDELRKRPEQYFVFSGRGILREALNTEKKLIHVHPGKLPEYRGSTCHLFSTLAGDGWHCTSFIMKPKIDEGDVIVHREFPLPGKNIDEARMYDPYARSQTLVDTVKQLAETGIIKTTTQDLSKGIDYYIIHPILSFITRKFLDSLN